MELREAMNSRRSIRSYTGEQITGEQLDAILTAAYEAPVGSGKYEGIHLTVITNKELLHAIDENAGKLTGNPSARPLYGAPMLIVVSSDRTDNVGMANVGFILQNMGLAAVEEGVGQCVIYGAIRLLNQNSALAGRLGLPEGYTALGGIELGKSDELYTKREIPETHKFVTNTIA